MSLGPDRTICKDEFVEAMRARLEAEESGSGEVVDRQDIQSDLGAPTPLFPKDFTVLQAKSSPGGGILSDEVIAK